MVLNRLLRGTFFSHLAIDGVQPVCFLGNILLLASDLGDEALGSLDFPALLQTGHNNRFFRLRNFLIRKCLTVFLQLIRDHNLIGFAAAFGRTASTAAAPVRTNIAVKKTTSDRKTFFNMNLHPPYRLFNRASTASTIGLIH